MQNDFVKNLVVVKKTCAVGVGYGIRERGHDLWFEETFITRNTIDKTMLIGR